MRVLADRPRAQRGVRSGDTVRVSRFPAALGR